MEKLQEKDRDEILTLNSLATIRSKAETTSKQNTEKPQLVKGGDAKPKAELPSDVECRRALRLWHEERETLDHIDIDLDIEHEPQTEVGDL